MSSNSKYQSTPLSPERVKTDGSSTKKDWEPQKPRGGKSQSAYDKYKQSLHEIFDGKKPMPNKMKDMLESQHPSVAQQESENANEPAAEATQLPAKKVRRRVTPKGPTLSDLIHQTKTSKTSAEVRDALSLIIEKGFTLPDDDEELLVKALDHDQDTIIIQALEQLAVFLDNKTSKNPGLLKSRLQSAQMIASNRKIRTRTNDLLALLN